MLLSGSWRALGIKYVKLLAQCHIMGTVGTMTRCHKVFTFSHNVSQFLPHKWPFCPHGHDMEKSKWLG